MRGRMTGRAVAVTAAIGLCASTAAGAPNDWCEGTPDANDGTTRDFYNRGAALPWRNLNVGDWIDSAGAEQGSAAFATTLVEDTDTERVIEWDVTALAQGWLDDAYPNQGVLLAALTGGGPIIFWSREHAPAGQGPRLVVDVGDGPVELVAEADTHTAPSTYTAQGAQEELRVEDGNSALVRFDLSQLTPGSTVISAALRLVTTLQYGDTEIGAFRPAPGRQGPPPPLETGLAADYVDDDGIADHPDVVFFEDYEAADWESHWSTNGGNYDVVDADPDREFEPLLGSALRAWIPEGENTGLNSGFNFQDELGEEPEEIYFRYYLRLGSSWDQTVDGGKLPGISGTYGVAGWGGRPVDGTNGWSARGLFRPTVPIGANPLGGFTPVGSYVYHADMATDYGDNFLWVNSWGPEGYGGVLARNHWYCLETYVQMNTLGQNDGIIRAWVDGRRSFEKTDFRFRDVDTLKIERVWMNIYHGGTALSPRTQHAFIDHVVIARSYIGPLGGTEPPPPPTDAGVPPDPGGDPDAGVTTEDASVPIDDPSGGAGGGAASAASGDSESEGGCGCSLASRSTTPVGALALLGAWLLWRRRRR